MYLDIDTCINIDIKTDVRKYISIDINEDIDININIGIDTDINIDIDIDTCNSRDQLSAPFISTIIWSVEFEESGWVVWQETWLLCNIPKYITGGTWHKYTVILLFFFLIEPLHLKELEVLQLYLFIFLL